MLVSIHQPHYIPWIGYFDKLDHADVFVILDTVQFEKNGWQNRNRIKVPGGWGWLTVPVKHSFGTALCDMEIENTSSWTRKHYNTIAGSYAKSPFWENHRSFFKGIYSADWKNLVELNMEILKYLVDELGIKTEIVKSSSLGSLPDAPNARLTSIVNLIGGDSYLAGGGASAYFEIEPFEKAGVNVIFQEYTPGVYSQLHGDFVPGLSVIDVLFNEGPNTLEIIRTGRRTVK